MPKIKKKPEIKYGIEITKPHSKEMYDHNNRVAKDMRVNVEYEIRDAHRRAIGTVLLAGGLLRTLQEL